MTALLLNTEEEQRFFDICYAAGHDQAVLLPAGIEPSRASDIYAAARSLLREDAKAFSQGGTKHDAGKARIELIAPEFIFGTADILTFGAEKYGVRNWEKGLSWSRCFAALMRHMWAWWAGEKNDAETGKPHLWHASCCLMFLVAFEARQAGTDDRKLP